MTVLYPDVLIAEVTKECTQRYAENLISAVKKSEHAISFYGQVVFKALTHFKMNSAFFTSLELPPIKTSNKPGSEPMLMSFR